MARARRWSHGVVGDGRSWFGWMMLYAVSKVLLVKGHGMSQLFVFKESEQNKRDYEFVCFALQYDIVTWMLSTSFELAWPSTLSSHISIETLKPVNREIS